LGDFPGFLGLFRTRRGALGGLITVLGVFYYAN
jgi:hypothetical protein